MLIIAHYRLFVKGVILVKYKQHRKDNAQEKKTGFFPTAWRQNAHPVKYIDNKKHAFSQVIKQIYLTKKNFPKMGLKTIQPAFLS